MMRTLPKISLSGAVWMAAPLVLAALLTTTSCLKEEDFRDFNKPSLNPVIAAPIGSAKLTIADLLNEAGDAQYIKEDSLGFLSIYYRSALISETAGEIIKFDRQETDTTLNVFFPVMLPAGDSLTLGYTFSQKFSNSYDDVVDSIRFRQGLFTIQIESMMDHDAKLLLSSPFLSKNNVPFSREFDLSYNGTIPVVTTAQISLDGYTFIFDHTATSNNLNFNVDLKVYGDNNPDPGPYNIQINLSQDNMAYRALFGLIKTRSMALLSDKIKLDLFEKGLGGNFRVNDPRIGIHFRNSFGIPISITIDPLKGHSDINPPYDVSLAGPGLPVPFMLNAPTINQVGQFANTSLILNKGNSNIDDFLNLLPNVIEYGVEGVINPSGVVPGNFVLDTSYFNVEVEIEIPLEGYASGFTLQDTMDFSFDTDIEQINMIDWILFRLNAESTFPIEATVQVVFLDSNYTVLDSLFKNPSVIVPGANPGPPPLYKATQPVYRTQDIKLDAAQISRIRKSKYILLRGTLDTAGGGNKVVKIYTDNYLQISFGVQAKVYQQF
jgi:hypothetical protein